MSALFEEARRTDIVGVAEQLGGRRLKRIGHERVGPCPKCGGVDRFGIHTRKRVFHCRGCAVGGDVVDLVGLVLDLTPRQAAEHLVGQDLPKAPERPQPKAPTDDEEIAVSQRKAKWLLSRRRPIPGSPVEVYLREVRGYRGPIPETLAYLPPTKPEHHPAMVAAFAFTSEPEPGVLALADHQVMAVHLTLLRPDGRGKAEGVDKTKLVVGQGSVGFPICLAPPNDLGGMCISEGIEDALSVHQATGLGAWAAGDAGRMPALADKVPSYVECVTIAAHADPAGQTGALALADALEARGIEVILQGVTP